MIPLIYKSMCPNCGREITSERLEKGIVCEKCLPEEVLHEEVCDFIGYGLFERVCDLWEKTKEFNKFFENILKNPLWSVQETWASRFFLGISHALLAPTGIGKTTFGLILSKYLIEKENKKVYLIFPTQMLVNQAYDRLISFGVNPENIIAYTSKHAKTKKKQEELKERIKGKDFKILLTTSMFLYKNIDIIPKGIFNLVFVDDVDSILKSAKNIDKVLMILGFSEEDIEETLKFLKFKGKIFKNKQPTEKEFEIFSNWQRKIEKISEKRKGVLIVSSATSNPKSKRVLLFRELLGFEVGRPSLTFRNITDVYEKKSVESLWESSVEKIKEFGNGGLVFLSSSETKDTLEKYIEFLKSKGIDAIHYENFWDRIEDFKSGKAPVAVGFASYRNPLARGVDLPDVIRYALFIGVPKLMFNISIEERFTHLYYFLLIVIPFLVRKKLIDFQTATKLYKDINFLKIYAFTDINKLDKNKIDRMKDIQKFALTLLKNKEIFEAIKNSSEITLKEENGEFILITADTTGYIQASGRTSRLYPGGLTKGLAYILSDDEKALYSLQKKVRWFSDDISIKPVEEVDVKSILKEIDKDREKVKRILKGEIIPEEKVSFKTTVVIVESPNKARTIANFFGKPLRRKLKKVDAYEIGIGDRFLTIVASKGHIFDLSKEDYFYGVKKINGKFIPIFEPITENEEKHITKKDIIDSIRELDLEVKEVFVATDPDTEGEKIAYDIYLNSKPYNLNIKRAEFHEITKWAFLEAVNNPREFDENLVKAQLIRRIADRWIGFTISQYVQKKLHKSWLSAGRVQTPVLEWIIKRTDEAKQKIAVIKVNIENVPVEFIFEDKNQGKKFFNALEFVIVEEETKQEEKLFEKPFSTDAMLKEAASKLGFSPQKTMQLAQDLFEAGLITYHRTDSIRVSPAGIAVAKEYITDNFGKEYLHTRTFQSSGGAHECIRPTRPIDSEDLRSMIYTMNLSGITKHHIELYDIVFKQFIASQMREATVEKTVYKVRAFDKTKEVSLITKIIEDGYNLILPIKIQSLQTGKYEVIHSKKYSLRPKVLYFTYAAIIQEMKEKGIGRPSTYAITIEKLIERHYIIERNGYLFPTKLGRSVLETIKNKEDFYKFVNENYTKELEELMDKVENNKEDYFKILNNLFKDVLCK